MTSATKQPASCASNATRIPVFHDTQRNVVTADFSLSDAYSGAPTMLHGGVTPAVLDEAMMHGHRPPAGRHVEDDGASPPCGVRRQAPHGRSRSRRSDEQRDHDHRQGPERQGVGLAEATATFTKLGDTQLKRAAGETGDTIDPSMRLG